MSVSMVTSQCYIYELKHLFVVAKSEISNNPTIYIYFFVVVIKLYFIIPFIDDVVERSTRLSV